MRRRVMRTDPGHASRRACCVVGALAVALALPHSVATPDPRERSRVPFTERYRAVQHGGLVRAANTVVTCEKAVTATADRCAPGTLRGGRNNDYRMTHVDVDDDRETRNSSRAELGLPHRARVSYARLYWGGNLRADERRPARDNGWVLFAEPGGSYKRVRADSTIGRHRGSGGRDPDGYTASADVTALVRDAGAGPYTVAEVNVATGHSASGTWGGWTLVVTYEDDREPLRELAVWDGYERLHDRRDRLSVTLPRPRFPARASGTLGLVAYDGDRGQGHDSLHARAGSGSGVRLHDKANPAGDVLNSTLSDRGRATRGTPAYPNTLGYDSDVLDLTPALARGGEGLRVDLSTRGDDFQLAALFLAATARR
ncbi:hypothetical protein [Streptomyces sp. NPDC005438]|uniref:hypothetical protein n=1 Tax=Streptomyces sp. NPDC005438 TaxID=3156880 RepID=UPI0033BCD550